MGWLLLLTTCLIGYGYHSTEALINIDIPTSYVNNQLEVFRNVGDDAIFKAPTCGYFDTGYNVTVKVYNPNNPQNSGDVGITYFAVSNKNFTGDIPDDEIICRNDQGTYTTTCTGPTGKGDIYVHVNGNNRYNIHYDVTVEFKKVAPLRMRAKPISRPFPFHTGKLGVTVREDLRQVITYDRDIELPYLNKTLIHLKFCPSRPFTVESILQADDPDAKSLISQAICKTKDCDFDTKVPARVGSNFYTLPVNIAGTMKGNYTDLWIYAVAYNGVLEGTPGNLYPVGKFLFGATIVPS